MSRSLRRGASWTFASGRSEVAQAWVDAYEELLALRTPQPTASTGLVSRALASALATRRARARAARIAVIAVELMRIGESLRWSAAGAPSASWGVLSAVSAHQLETTLDSIASDDAEDEEVRRAAKDITAGVPLVRAHAELGQHEHVRSLEQQVRRLSDSHGLSATSRRRLIDHLPGNIRPLPASLDDLDSARSLTRLPVTLYVTMHGPDQRRHYAESHWIKLNDIVVARGARGRGIGSATLAELCRFADHHGIPIQGNLQPGPGAPEEAVASLAHWYYKRGFLQSDLDPGRWRRFGLIRREPSSTPSSN